MADENDPNGPEDPLGPRLPAEGEPGAPASTPDEHSLSQEPQLTPELTQGTPSQEPAASQEHSFSQDTEPSEPGPSEPAPSEPEPSQEHTLLQEPGPPAATEAPVAASPSVEDPAEDPAVGPAPPEATPVEEWVIATPSADAPYPPSVEGEQEIPPIAARDDAEPEHPVAGDENVEQGAEEEPSPLAARDDIEPEIQVAATAEPALSAEQPPLVLQETNAKLPSTYFRAAGDPDEPPEEPDNSFAARLGQMWRQFRAFAEPKYVAFMGGARAFGRQLWARIRGVRHPRSVREAAVWTGWVAAGFVALVVGFFFFVTWDMPSTDDLWEARGGQSITFLDRSGHVILREGAQNAPPVDLAALPPYVPQAFVAIEDRRFYQHFGVDLGGMMRAGAENMRAGHVVQGGSTITQQLAKNLFLSNERSWRRKLQEVAMAIWLETKFTKQEILALYLSRVYFGAGAYGIEAAAERYFDRPAHDLTLLQSAMLAGLVKAPSRLNPASQDMAAARARADTVLQEMVNIGYITEAQRHAALQEDLVVSRRNPAGVLSYYRDWVDPELNRIIGTQRDDFIVETTIDIAAQRAANDSVNAVLNEQGQVRQVGEAGLLAMDDNGGVRAMIGGRDYEITQFNRTTQAHRQPGSSFKFFIYLAAMENGLTPWSVREDAPVVVHIAGQPDYVPGNYGNRFHGAVTLTEALQNSYNMVALRLTQEIGGQRVIDVARRLGITTPLHNYPSLGLGAQEVTLYEMVRAYATMANNGYNVEPHGIVRIRRASTDEVMWSWRPERHVQLIADRPRRLLDYMMNRVVEAGTGTHARMPGRQIAGKTGTGNDYRDAWFIGFTPGYVTGVWVGNDNFTITDRVTGGSLPTDIWQRFMQVALRNEPARPLDMPSAEDFNSGLPQPEVQSVTAVGAPIGAITSGPPASQGPQDNQDHSLDVGPQG